MIKAIVALIGSSRLGGILYSYWPALDYTNAGAEPARTREYSLESMAVIADEAASRGIQLNLEVVNRYENFVFNDVDCALAYITELKVTVPFTLPSSSFLSFILKVAMILYNSLFSSSSSVKPA